MKCGCTGTKKKKGTVFTVSGRTVTTSKQKKACQSWSKVKMMLIVLFFFLIGWALFNMNLFYVVRQSIHSFTWTSWIVWKSQCNEWDRNSGETRPGCRTMTMHLLTCHSLSLNFNEARDYYSPTAALLSRSGTLKTFFVPTVEIHAESLPFQMIEETEEIHQGIYAPLQKISSRMCSRNWKYVGSGV